MALIKEICEFREWHPIAANEIGGAILLAFDEAIGERSGDGGPALERMVDALMGLLGGPVERAETAESRRGLAVVAVGPEGRFEV